MPTSVVLDVGFQVKLGDICKSMLVTNVHTSDKDCDLSLRLTASSQPS